MFATRLCDLLDIEYPILQGGMAWVSTAELAAAVSEAGGLGIIAGGNHPSDYLQEQVRKAKELTEKPFGVNVMLLSPFVDDLFSVIIEERVPVVTTGAGTPGKYLPALKEVGTRVIPVVASVALAKRLEKQGVDALIAEGMESGGHIGETTTMALVPPVEIPVIAAGGVADGRGFLAALSLGADGVQMGTRFICAEECTVHQGWKEAILKARDRDTVITGRPTGHPVRIIKNRLAREFERLEKESAPLEEFDKLGAGRLEAAAVRGDVEHGSVMAGQVSGLVAEIIPARDIIRQVVSEAAEAMNTLNNLSRQPT
jgi:enoyl-[acyl-carrier protein] reductase II